MATVGKIWKIGNKYSDLSIHRLVNIINMVYFLWKEIYPYVYAGIAPLCII